MVLKLIAVLAASLGFGARCNLHGKKLALAALGGVLSWGCNRLMGRYVSDPNLCALAAAVLLSLYSEFMARRLRAPATIFMTVAAIPMIPGAGLYRAARALMQGDWALASEQALLTLLLAASLAAGIATVSLIFRLLPHK